MQALHVFINTFFVGSQGYCLIYFHTTLLGDKVLQLLLQIISSSVEWRRQPQTGIADCCHCSFNLKVTV